MIHPILRDFGSNVSLLGWQENSGTLILQIKLVCQKSRCPDCQHLSVRVHSRYKRRFFDLPVAGLPVEFVWCVRRFFCDNPDCIRRTFAEQYPKMVDRYARKTNRLRLLLQQFGFELGGEAGKRVTQMLGTPVSGDYLLNLVRTTAEKSNPPTRFLGVDDWAIRKRHSYGTILVDLERRIPIDLLSDREAATLANWLKAHPEVEVISRDRGQAYINGIVAGAPGAIQVADRFHLLMNLKEAVQRMFEKRLGELRKVEKQLLQAATENEITTDTNPTAPTVDLHPPQDPKTWKQLRFEQVKELQQQGVGQRAVARKMGLNRRTVRRYFELDQLPPRASLPPMISSAFPFLPYLEKRWREGQQNRKQLLAEIRKQGFQGSYASVWRITSKFPETTMKPVQTTVSRWSPRQAAWLLVCEPDKLTEENIRKMTCLCDHSPSALVAYPLVQRFGQMVREGGAQDLDDWLKDAEESKITELKRFAEGLRSDYGAVKAALLLPWSSGQVEGQVNRLKLIKRQMYGRAGFQLLRRRVLGSPLPP
jgi:transposase